ncbi:MAG: AAA family ATPase, partial [Caldilineaceae bacterium]|nr:AAA family ATPase [Caldilineaceae bacterium]
MREPTGGDSSPMAGSLHFSLLGDPQVTNNNVAVTGFISSKAQALLYYLAATGQPHSRDHLAALFWGHMSSAAARKNLTKALSNLRKLIGAVLITDHQNAALAAEAVALDLHAFHALLQRSPTSPAEPDPNSLAHLPVDQVWRANELYRGPFLNNFVVRDAPEFELWMETMREECRRLLTVAVENAAEQALHAGALEQALALSERTLHHESTWEPAHRRLMTLLARLERVEEALAHYERCRHTLAQELGVEPAVETTQLYESLKAAHTPPPHNLPTATTRFVGRETELLALSTLLCSADCRLLTITGAGGVGKTRLALQLANQFTNPLTTHTFDCSFPHGIYFLSLTSLDSAETIIAMMAERLGFTFYVEGNSKKQLLDALQDRRTLLVLDNVEHLVDREAGTDDHQGRDVSPQPASALTALVTEMLVGSAHLKIVVTSRARLNMHGEHLFSLGGLHFPEQLGRRTERGTGGSSRLADLVTDTEYSAVQLFIQCARRLQSDYVLLDEDWPVVVRICQLVQGMPLGILLAAAWLDIYTPAEIAEEINRSFDFLAADLPDLPLRQRSIRAAIDHSWRMLAPQEQHLFERLSIFRGSFSRRAAQQVTNATPHLLQSLVKKSLLQSMVQGRFALHELLRQYANERLDATSPAALDIGRRHSAYFAEATVAWTPALKDERQQQTLKAMETDSENLRVAWQWSIAQGHVEQLLAMVNGLSQFYVWRGRYQEGAEGIASAMARLPFFSKQDDPLPVAQLHVSLTIWHGLFLRLLGQIEQALQRCHEALAQLQRAPLITEEMRAEEGFAWLQLGHALRDRDRRAAQDAYERSLQAYRAINEAWGTANALDA